MTGHTGRTPLFTPILIAGSLFQMMGFAFRAPFSVFQIPIAESFGWQTGRGAIFP